MGGEQNADVLEPRHLPDRVADVLLGDHVQADRRLIEQDEFGAVQERCRYFTPHALPEGELPDRSFQEILDLERLGDLPDPQLGIAVIHFIDLAEERERVDGGEVVPELRALTEDRADVIGELLPFLPGDVTQHFRLAARRVQDARQHLDRGGFPRAVRTDKAQQLARFHLEGESPHRLDRTVFRLEQRAHGAAHPRGFAFGLEGFVEVGDFDGRHSERGRVKSSDR